ncbi:MAG: MFS transporter [Spirochaetaceae bacterium]|nr:MFS transporter [Spirochaetaceae bacterium]
MLSASAMKQGRKFFNLYQVITCFSFPLVNGTIITLYAIRIGASASLIGILSSFNFIAFLIVPLGKMLQERIGAAKALAWGQVLRYVAISPLLFLPIFYGVGNLELAYLILIIAIFGFNFFRGISLIGLNPVIDSLVPGKQLSRYLMVLAMLNFIFTPLALILLVVGLHVFNASILSYNLFIILGIATGFWSAYYLFKVPSSQRQVEKTSLLQSFKTAWGRWSFKRFIVSYFVLSFFLGLSRPYIAVYTRQIYNQSDSMTILLTTIGTLGSLMMALFSRTIVNLVGSKTLYIFFMTVATLSLLPAIITPALVGGALFTFLAIFHFTSTFGMQGVESNSQTYLFTVIRKEEVGSLAIIWYMVFGVAGAIGSTLGGYLIDLFPVLFNVNLQTAFQLLFSIALIGYVVTLIFLTRLQNSSKHSVSDGLGFILNFKDIKAISLANQLENSLKPDDQIRLLQQIAHSQSDAPTELLTETLYSPKMSIRRQALFTLESIPPTKDSELAAALITQLNERTHTTAYMAARLLGSRKVESAIPYLRRALTVGDNFLLQGEAIRALASLNDKASIPDIYSFILPQKNIFITIQAINALEILLEPEAVTMLFKPFKWPRLFSDSVGSEAILAITGLLGLNDWFYPIYVSYTRNPNDGYELLYDLYSSNKRKYGANQKLEELLLRPSLIIFRRMAGELSTEQPFKFTASEIVQRQLTTACANPVVIRYAKVRFLFTALFVASHIRVETKRKVNRK